MKKFIITIVSLFLIITLVIVHFFAFQLTSFHPTHQSSSLKQYINYDSIFYTTFEDAEKSLLNNVTNDIKDFLSTVPNEFREFEKDGWKIIISSTRPTYITEIEEKVGYKIGGNTYKDYRLIFLYLNEETPEYLLEDFIHEFGHYVDLLKGYPSRSNEFKKLFDDYKNNFDGDGFVVNNYTISSPVEFFASCYKDYQLDSDGLKNNSIEVYEFIESSLEDDFLLFYKRFIRYYF